MVVPVAVTASPVAIMLLSATIMRRTVQVVLRAMVLEGTITRWFASFP
jgi:hypothetical protein